MLNLFMNCKNSGDCLRLVMTVLVVLILQMFLVKYFWNKALVPHITVLKPITSLLDALMLSVGISTVTALA